MTSQTKWHFNKVLSLIGKSTCGGSEVGAYLRNSQEACVLGTEWAWDGGIQERRRLCKPYRSFKRSDHFVPQSTMSLKLLFWWGLDGEAKITAGTPYPILKCPDWVLVSFPNLVSWLHQAPGTWETSSDSLSCQAPTTKKTWIKLLDWSTLPLSHE